MYESLSNFNVAEASVPPTAILTAGETSATPALFTNVKVKSEVLPEVDARVVYEKCCTKVPAEYCAVAGIDTPESINMRVAVETTEGFELVTNGALEGIAYPFASLTVTAIAGSESADTFLIWFASARPLVRIVGPPSDPLVPPAELPTE
jgi:hypothetical protein